MNCDDSILLVIRNWILMLGGPTAFVWGLIKLPGHILKSIHRIALLVFIAVVIAATQFASDKDPLQWHASFFTIGVGFIYVLVLVSLCLKLQRLLCRTPRRQPLDH